MPAACPSSPIYRWLLAGGLLLALVALTGCERAAAPSDAIRMRLDLYGMYYIDSQPPSTASFDLAYHAQPDAPWRGDVPTGE